VRDHADRYGCYAIGMKKEWGVRKKVTPAIYTYQNSPLPLAMKSLFDKIKGMDQGGREIWAGDLLTLSVYLKDYEGRFWRNGAYLPDLVRFYDEREWRYVPTPEQLTQVGCLPSTVMDRTQWPNKAYVDRENQKLQGCKLGFTADDVKYLIVEKESEISRFIDIVKEIKAPKYKDRTVELLLTRIISMEQIREDF